MRVDYLDVDMCLENGIICEARVYLDSVLIENCKIADTKKGEITCISMKYGVDYKKKGNVEIYIPNDEEKFPGIKRILECQK